MKAEPLFGQENTALLLGIINSSPNATLKAKHPQQRDKEAMSSDKEVIISIGQAMRIPFFIQVLMRGARVHLLFSQMCEQGGL